MSGAQSMRRVIHENAQSMKAHNSGGSCAGSPDRPQRLRPQGTLGGTSTSSSAVSKYIHLAL